MSLAIDSRYITGIYALGQWFKVKKGTVEVDAYEFTDWEEPDPHDGNRWEVAHTNYQLGELYADTKAYRATYGENSRARFASPSGCHGISFVDTDTGERVSFSMMEVRAFREERP